MKKTEINAMRYDESGDFFSQACIDKMSYVSKKLKPYGIKLYGYSARSDLDFTKAAFIVRGSGFMSKNGKTIVIDYKSLKKNEFFYNGKLVNLVKKNNWYQIKTNNETFFLCPGDCRQCRQCLKTKGNIAFINHKSSHRHSILPKKIKGKGKYIVLNKKYNVKLTLGNSKLPNDTAILNLGDATTCPSKRLGLCKCEGDCYAMKPEKMYPKTTLPARIRSKIYWLKNDKKTIWNDIKQALRLK